MATGSAIAERLAALRQRIAAVGGGDVEIMAVSKTVAPERIAAALAAGVTRLGESYAAEVVDKYADRSSPVAGVRPDFIGRLQTNKVRTLRGLVGRVCSVDRPSLVTELARRMPGVAVLVQVNATGETTKGGCPPEVTETLVAQCRHAGLHVDGLMTIGPTSGDAASTRAAFRVVRRQVDSLGLEVCSMGMSHDLEIAVEEGATQVRIGTAIFGPRASMRQHAGLT